MVAIQTEKLTKSYGSARGVVDLDLSVAVGEVFGFLGPNGAGKTTTIRVLLDLIRPTRGSARVLGLDSRRDSIEIRRRTGYLPGELALYERLTGRALLGFLGRLRGGLDHAYATVLAERLRLELDRPVRTLSKGNRQKLGLVQAFVHRPELLILDEPTSGLDPLVQHEFQLLVAEAVAEGRTVLLSSHVLSEVEHVARFRVRPSVALKSIRDARRGLAWWTGGILLLVCAIVLGYPTVRDNPDFDRVGESYPETLQAFVGGENGLDLQSGPGYLNAELFSLMVPLLLLVYAIGTGARAIAGEEEAGTLDLLLAHPLSRSRLAVEKLAALAVLLAALATATFVALIVSTSIVEMEIAVGGMAAATASVWLLALAHGAIALTVGAATGSRSLAIGVAAGVGVVGYLLAGLAELIDVLRPWRLLSFFHYVDTDAALRSGFDAGSSAVLAAAVALAAVLALPGLRRRDLAV